MSDNVIVLPVANRRTPANNMDEAYSSIESARIEQIKGITLGLVSYIMSEIIDLGYSVDDPKCMNDHFLMVEAMQAMMYRAVALYHPLHDTTDEMFNFEGLENEDNEEC